MITEQWPFVESRSDKKPASSSPKLNASEEAREVDDLGRSHFHRQTSSIC
jgi:hypothetical protein